MSNREQPSAPLRFPAEAKNANVQLVRATLLGVTTSPGELAENELLGHACADSFSDADRNISEYQPDTAIRSGIVKVCEAG